MNERVSELVAACDTPASLREFADALDKDRGHGKSYVTLVMREAATEIERLRAALTAIAEHPVVSESDIPGDNCDWHCTVTMTATAKDALEWPVADGNPRSRWSSRREGTPAESRRRGDG